MAYISLTQNQVTIVDIEDLDFANKPCYAWFNRTYSNGGAYIAKQGDKYLHRLILQRVIGRVLSRDEEVDHINRNPLDNRRCNLRLATKIQNNRNQSRRKDNKSGYKGVSWYKRYGKWVVKIMNQGVIEHLGYFDDLVDAARAYDKRAKIVYGEFAVLNFKEEVFVE